MQQPLFVTGMMGCGKTTVGQVLASRLGVRQIDLDQRIERLFGSTVAELFAQHGEPYFRAREAEALLSLLAEPGLHRRAVVVTTGGGTVLDAGNREAMDRIGARVYVHVGVDELVRRLQPSVQPEGTRPLLGEHPGELRTKITALLAARQAIYRTAEFTVDGEGPPELVAARVIDALGLSPQVRDSEAV